MKIALCKTAFAGPVSGADETLVTYATALQQTDNDVQVVLLYRCAEDDQYYVRLKNAGVPVVFLVRRSLLFNLLRVMRDLLASALFFVFLVPQAKNILRRTWQALIAFLTRPRYRICQEFLSETRPDVVHVFTPDTGAMLMIRAGHGLGIPVLYHELGTPNHLPMLNGYYERLKKVLPLCSEVAALSPRLADEWTARFPFLRKISVVPILAEQSKAFNLFVRKRGNSKAVFGYAARLEEGKGPLVLLDAIRQVNRETPLAVVRIAGVGEQSARVRARARSLGLDGACEFVGVYSDPLGRGAFMNSLDVFVLPSFAEGTPNSIVEAMANGIPIIASDVGGIADMIGNDAGILVTAGDAEALAEAMRRLATDATLRKQMGERAKQRYHTLFTPQAVVPLLLDTYDRIMAKKKNRDEINGHHPWSAQSMRNLSKAPAAEIPLSRTSSP